MWLAYLDDAGSDLQRRYQLMVAVVMHDSMFLHNELIMAGVVKQAIPPEQLEEFWLKFEEFHASELFGGYGAFGAIERSVRMKMIEELLRGFAMSHGICYGCVDRHAMRKHIHGSANHLDVCFRICLNAIKTRMERVQKYVSTLPWPPADSIPRSFPQALLIADDCAKDKKVLSESFHQVRARIKFIPGETELSFLHDDIYFGDSKYCIGIQIADLCAYFISKHLEGDTSTVHFYKLIEPFIFYWRIEPDGKEFDSSVRDKNA